MINTLIQSLNKQLDNYYVDHKPSDANYLSLTIKINPAISLVCPDIDNSFYITKPETGFSLLGLGHFMIIEAEGTDRFQSIKSKFSKILNKWTAQCEPDIDDVTSPVAFLGFAFDENDPMMNQWQAFSNTALIIPEVLIREHNGLQTLTVNINLDSCTHNDRFISISKYIEHYLNTLQTIPEHHIPEKPEKNPHIEPSWLTLSQQALSEINSGRVDKLVLSRQSSLTFEQTVSVHHIIENLKKHYHSCTILCYRQSGHTVMAASPENLLRLHHPNIQSDAIGGTIQRKRMENGQFASLPLPLHSLLSTDTSTSESKKLLKEHLFIAQDIYNRLDPLCKTLIMPGSPLLMKLHHLYHLETPIHGQLMDEVDLFDVIKALHPTPAVAGSPAQIARQWLLENENYHRGWYTGAFGWLDGHLNGELSVLLRCAIHKDRQIDLFAGAGLVAESDAEQEWHETELKMQTILDML